ncbi:MAG: RHS repeat-associated core domain-containing protein, partial [Pseudomonadota bacterium]
DEAGNRYETIAYDAQGRGVSTQLAGGANLYSISYGASAGAPTVVTDPLGTPRSYNYGTSFSKLAVTGADKPSGSGGSDAASRVQNASGLVESETDFLGVQTMYTWDINRRLPLSTTKAAGRPEAQTVSTQWHPTFRLPVLVTEAGRSTAYTYDGDGNKLTESITDTATSQVRSWAWTYVASGATKGLVASMTDPKGGVWSYGYDSSGNRTSVTNPLGQVSQYSYDTAGRLATETAPNGLVTTYGYDQRSRVISASIGSGAQAELTTYSYNLVGKLAGTVLPSGYSASYSYDAAQRLIGATDNRGNSVAYTLDAMGNRTREEIKDAANTLALATGRVINSLNRVATVQGAAGQSTVLGYDANGEAVSQADPLNQTTAQTLDGLRRPTATTFPDNASASQSWNALDQLAQVTDPKGVATQYQRNAFGEVMSELNPDAGTTTYQRNLAGEVTGQVDAKGNSTSITRDALGRPLTVTRTSPGGTATPNVTSYTWDSGGLLSTGSQVGYLAKVEDKSGVSTYERDAFGRVLSKTQRVNDNPSSPSSFKTSYTYSTGINKGLLASIVYPSGLTVYYNRNASGQITGMSTKVAGNNRPVVPFISNLTYTALGTPKAWDWNNGDAAARTFDADGRMASNEFASYQYDAASRITGITQSLWASRTVTSVISTGTGTVTAVVTERYQTPLSWTVGYDNRNRVTGFNRSGAQTSYSYDANSNRLSSVDKVTSDTDLDGTYEIGDVSVTKAMGLQVDSASNKLLGFTQTQTRTRGTRTLATTSSAVNYSLDANGSLTFDGSRSFDYDEANRLAKIRLTNEGEAAAIAYLHNAWGQRVFKGEPTPETLAANQTDLGTDFIAWLKTNFKWLYESAQANTSVGTAYTYGDGPLPEWALLGEYDNGSATGKGRSEYIWLPTEDGNTIPVGMFRNNKFFAIHSDHLGSPRLMTNDLNVAVWQWPYSAFGETKPTGVLRATPNPNVAITNQPVLLRATAATEMNLRFPGQYADIEAGNFYNYLREYDAATGRYRQSDPIGLNGGLNRFGYVEGNPLGDIDPFGLEPVGHHFVPQSLWKNEPLQPDTRRVFDRATTGPIPGGHNYGDGHNKYNEATKEMYEKWKGQNKIQCETMTPKQAEDFVRQVKQSTDPRVREFNNRIYQRIINGAFRRIPGGRGGNE